MIEHDDRTTLNDGGQQEILDEWDRTDIGFAQRVTDLTSGGSGALNGPYDLTLSTVSSNHNANSITSEHAARRIAPGHRGIVNPKGDVW